MLRSGAERQRASASEAKAKKKKSSVSERASERRSKTNSLFSLFHQQIKPLKHRRAQRLPFFVSTSGVLLRGSDERDDDLFLFSFVFFSPPVSFNFFVKCKPGFSLSPPFFFPFLLRYCLLLLHAAFPCEKRGARRKHSKKKERGGGENKVKGEGTIGKKSVDRRCSLALTLASLLFLNSSSSLARLAQVRRPPRRRRFRRQPRRRDVQQDRRERERSSSSRARGGKRRGRGVSAAYVAGGDSCFGHAPVGAVEVLVEVVAVVLSSVLLLRREEAAVAGAEDGLRVRGRLLFDGGKREREGKRRRSRFSAMGRS